MSRTLTNRCTNITLLAGSDQTKSCENSRWSLVFPTSTRPSRSRAAPDILKLEGGPPYPSPGQSPDLSDTGAFGGPESSIAPFRSPVSSQLPHGPRKLHLHRRRLPRSTLIGILQAYFRSSLTTSGSLAPQGPRRLWIRPAVPVPGMPVNRGQTPVDRECIRGRELGTERPIEGCRDPYYDIEAGHRQRGKAAQGLLHGMDIVRAFQESVPHRLHFTR